MRKIKIISTVLTVFLFIAAPAAFGQTTPTPTGYTPTPSVTITPPNLSPSPTPTLAPIQTPAITPAVPYNLPDELYCTPPGGQVNSGINTAIGCIPTDIGSGGLISSILRLAVGLGGGIALVLMLYGTFIITTSAGIPDKLKAGREIITSAIVGLIFIILSIVIMEFIGVQILGLPGL